MSDHDQFEPKPQFSQSQPVRPDRIDLDRQYKSIGISAVSAAASFIRTKRRDTPPQMS